MNKSYVTIGNLNNKNKFDLSYCDFLKIAMMLIVIFTHSISLWSRSGWFNQSPTASSHILELLCDMLGTFHVYVFTFVSGYLFFFLKYEKNKYICFKKDIKSRFTRLIVPYIFISLLWVIPFYIYFFDTNFYDITLNFFFAVSPGQLWFLVMLFMVFVIFYSLSDNFNNMNTLSGIFICLLFYALGVGGLSVFNNYFQIFNAFKYLIFYYIGFLFRKYKENNILYRIPWILYFLIYIIVFSVWYFYLSEKSGLIYSLLKTGMLFICNITGTLTIIMGISFYNLERLKKNSLYLLLKKHNFFMYLIHQQIIYITITLFNSKANTFTLVVINFSAAFIISLLIAIVISKIPVVNKFFGYK